MKGESKKGRAMHAPKIIAVLVVAMLTLGVLGACSAGGANGSNGSSEATTANSPTKTLVKTAANELALVDWDVTSEDSPLTVSSDDPKYAEFAEDLAQITGFDIESLTMQVNITTVQGAEIAATHETTSENHYTIKSLDAVVDGQTVSYTDGDFK